MKRGVTKSLFCLSLVIILSLSLVSAGFFGDVWGKITGELTVNVLYPCIMQAGSNSTNIYATSSDELWLTEEQCLSKFNSLVINGTLFSCSSGYAYRNVVWGISLILKEDYCGKEPAEPITLTSNCSKNICTLYEADFVLLYVGNNSYNVSIVYISNSVVKLKVNGVLLNSLGKLESYKLDDGNILGVQDILYDSKEAGISGTVFSVSVGEEEVTCTDSDGGIDYFSRGNVIGLEVPEILDSWWDYCGTVGEEKGKLVEYTCREDNYGEKVFYDCSNGCQEGACLPELTSNLTCTDSDGGINYYVKGKACEGSKCNEDSCQDETYLLESDCGWESGIKESSHSGLGGSGYECPNGCQDGACVIKEVNEYDRLGKCQENFKMAFILLTPKGTNPSQESLNELNLIKSEFAKDFNYATSGLGIMDTSYPVQIVEIDESDGNYVWNNLKNILLKFYETNSLEFDFINFYGEGIYPSLVGADHLIVQESFKGKGQSISDFSQIYYDLSETYGDISLLGINFMYDLQLRDFTLENKDSWKTGLLHETGHQWCCYLGDNFAKGENDASLEIIQQSIHFYRGLNSPYEGSSPMNSDTWVPNGDGSYKRLLTRSDRYHPFQLYFMGLLDDENYDLNKKFKVFDAGIPGKDFNDKKAYPYKEVSINDLIKVEGKRTCSNQCQDGACIPDSPINETPNKVDAGFIRKISNKLYRLWNRLHFK
jgi:hypothetical protein